MKLPELLKILPDYKTSASEIEVLSLTNDARQVHLGSVFVAVKGTSMDGHSFLSDACRAGALALVVENAELVPKDFTGFVQVVKNSREALDQLAGQFYSFPSSTMMCFGVTGTNGKTSITYMLECVLDKVGMNCGVLGTVNHHLKKMVWPTSMTTPDPVALQKRLQEMKQGGAQAVAMEISSHALDQHRADAVQFDTVIFTNLTRDHLDYHKNMQEYFQAKQRLFTDLMWASHKPVRAAIINLDDPWGARLRVAGAAECWTYGENKRADFQYKITKLDFLQTDFVLKTPWGVFPCALPLTGAYNVANAVAVIAAAASQGIHPHMSLKALNNFEGVPGRMQAVANNKEKNVFVDYAHSPDALENVLKTISEIRITKKSPAKIWTVFGCGGDRDKGKRPLMAEIAAKYSDQVIVTSDNPRTEDAQAIIQDILKGISNKQAYVEADRRKAIGYAIENSQAGDVILIAGKGHEDYQIIGSERHHFSDIEVAREFLR